MQNTKSSDLLPQVLFIADLEKIIGRDRLTLRRWWVKGKFPKPVKLNGTTLAWSTKIIDEWIDQSLRNECVESVNQDF